ncbi:39S ribosomal protein L45, mitochondrial [Phlyctochytrium planicorne]|nr:39S ribosomal protein L45, mitochondrial [Phlyctochytrium planicorne]
MPARPVSFNIVDRYIPPPFNPLEVLSADGRKVMWKRLKKTIQWMLSLYQLKKGKVPLIGMRKSLEDLYMKMNKAFAEGDEKVLERVATDSMRAIINPEVKKLRRLGQGKWALHGSPTSKIVHIATVGAQGDSGAKTGRFVQVTMKITSVQSFSIYVGDRLVGGDPNLKKTETEFVVFERLVTDKDSRWQVAGKITTEKKK